MTELEPKDLITETIENIESEEFYNQEDDTLDIESTERKIVWQAKDFSIREFLSMRQDGELALQPEYQRNFVAPVQIASRLIESILLDVPIPVIYLAEDKDGSYSVIDGQQRLTSFLSFLDGKFPNGDEFKLSGLKVLSDLNRKKYTDLDKDQQTKIKTTTLHSIIIKKESNEDIKFEIFERLNTGSTKLNEDEIRNTVYRGDYIKLLADLSENSTFNSLVQKPNFKNRMIYRGMILRFLALSEKSYINYKSSMKQFCNKELRDNKSLSKEKRIEYKNRFEHCLDLVKTVFGDKSFKRYISGNESEQGKWTRQLNMALFDLQMVGFVNYSKNEVLSNADLIREGLLELMIEDPKFQEVIGFKTSDTDNVKKRFKMYMDMLEKVIGDKSYQQRTFSFSIKEELFKQNPYCAISKQKILAIEDAEVDHIIPYSKGGKTEKENAQLVLRYFNRAKKDKM
ncbi:HNH endonuclease family protein [Flavobacterium sp. 3HN19-14]|uniref:HNH endonuclease family protein n=1 Tax=Flavobacterium sp. 3HN19-14 TaxID=3448133 RepID=UPI003EE1A03F